MSNMGTERHFPLRHNQRPFKLVGTRDLHLASVCGAPPGNGGRVGVCFGGQSSFGDAQARLSRPFIGGPDDAVGVHVALL